MEFNVINLKFSRLIFLVWNNITECKNNLFWNFLIGCKRFLNLSKEPARKSKNCSSRTMLQNELSSICSMLSCVQKKEIVIMLHIYNTFWKFFRFLSNSSYLIYNMYSLAFHYCVIYHWPSLIIVEYRPISKTHLFRLY